MTDKWNVDLTGKVALITGGSRGMGLEIAQAYAASGADVVIASRKAQPCIDAANDLTKRFGVNCLGVGCHVGDWDQCDALVEQVISRYGQLDILVNNAGMSPLYENLADVSQALFDKVIAVNARGPFRLASLAGTHMAANKGGVIINVSSIAAVQPTPNELPYAMAKSGLNAMTIAMARAFGPQVRVNCIMPGPFLTDIAKAWNMDEFNERARNSIPLERGGEPDEVVGAALYLASDLSSYTTGAVIKIDGGSAFTPA